MLSLETCLKLKEAGWSQEWNCTEYQLYWWDCGRMCDCQWIAAHDHPNNETITIKAACPTLEELLGAVRALVGMANAVGLVLYPDGNACCYLYQTSDLSNTDADDDCLCGIEAEAETSTSPSEAAAALWLKLNSV